MQSGRQCLGTFRPVGWLAGLLGPVAIGCAPVALSVDDAVVMSGRKTRFAAYLERELFPGASDGVGDVTVRFLVDGREVARANTDGEGQAIALAELSAESPSQFEARATLRGRTLRTTGAFYAWRADAVILAVDIDGTIVDTDYDALFLKPEDRDSRPIHGAHRVLTRLATDFHLFYLTARPRFVLDKTRRWLARHAFPRAPVLTAHRVRDMIAQAKYKRHTLTALKELWPNLVIGIGNTGKDAEVYGAGAMLTLIVNDSAEARYRPHALVFPTWDSVGAFFDANREILTAPEKLKDVMANGRMLLRPVVPWKKED